MEVLCHWNYSPTANMGFEPAMQVWRNPRYYINNSLTVRWSNRGDDNRNGREGGNNQNESAGGGNDELVEATARG